MKTNIKLNNLAELKAKQASLKAEQVTLGKEIISEGKNMMISLPVQGLLKPADPLKMLKTNGKINLPGKNFSQLLALVVNRTLFRRSGFVTRIITAMIARKIGRRIGPKIASWFLAMIKKFTQKPKPLNPMLNSYPVIGLSKT